MTSARPTPFRPCALRTTALALLGLSSLGVPTAAQAQTPGLEGRVVQQDGTPVRHAEVGIVGTHRTVVTSDLGGFEIRGLGPGEHRLVISAPGYGTRERAVTLPLTSPLVVVLQAEAMALEALTVTGTMQRTSVADAPVRVEVVPARVLQRNATNNLTEAIQYVNGLHTQVECGVCYTNSIRINGMEGPYTAVLIDGMPIMGSLASVYGLNGINPALIERIEIVKGPSSTLYGSEAMAGVVNVITKDPRFAPRYALDVSTTSDAEANIDFAVAAPPGDLSGFVSGNVAYNQRFVDGNGDGFSDFPLMRRAVLFGKVHGSDDGQRRGGLSARYLYEDRFGGVAEWTRRDRGSAEVYGEWVETHRAELLGSWVPTSSAALRMEGSYTWHDQRSFYGDEHYDASQHIGFANLLWAGRTGAHSLLVGLTGRAHLYDDNTPATPEPERRFVPGLLAQDEVRWGGGSSLLTGLRADHHGAHGLILSPRLAVKWEAAEGTDLRLNWGTGFRVVNLFTEDHAALSGARDVLIASDLQPERSRTLSFNMNQVIEFGPNPMMIDVDVFHTRFSNKIVPDYDQDPSLIVYDNLRGHAVSRGVGIAFNQNVDFDRFLYSVGVTFQDVYVEEGGRREAEFFAPRVRGVASAAWAPRRLPLTLDYTGSATGPMRMPSYDEPFSRPERSPAYSVHNVQATWRTAARADLYVAAKNVLGYVQPTPLINPSDPFSETFDTAYVYGPLRGRHLMVGLRYGAPR